VGYKQTKRAIITHLCKMKLEISMATVACPQKIRFGLNLLLEINNHR